VNPEDHYGNISRPKARKYTYDPSPNMKNNENSYRTLYQRFEFNILNPMTPSIESEKANESPPTPVIMQRKCSESYSEHKNIFGDDGKVNLVNKLANNNMLKSIEHVRNEDPRDGNRNLGLY